MNIAIENTAVLLVVSILCTFYDFLHEFITCRNISISNKKAKSACFCSHCIIYS